MFNLEPQEEDAYAEECHECSEKGETLFCAKKRLEKVVERLYDVKPLYTLALEEDLDELCFLLGIKLVPKDLLIARTKPINLTQLKGKL